ncbi:MAG: hypothetical protein GC153_05010 [Alphaproteobacteria bacterium]|nr:hypothetical protein [Alphaproteobacteria bacterium]
MTVAPSDIIGIVGVALIVVTYFLSQIGRMSVTEPLYPALNAVGSLLILISLAFTMNIASAAIEAFWLLISAVGLVRALTIGRKKND